jgi:hypothetical protein
MAGDRICVQQTPHPIVQPHPPAGNPVAAPARGVTPGDPGDNTALQPAAPVPKLRVPGPATDPKAAEKQAEKDTYALADAQKNLAKLENATPEQISDADDVIRNARQEAERSTVHNATVQYENRARKLVIVKLADTELARLRNSDQHRSPPTRAELDAWERLYRATDDFVESNDSFVHAEQMLYEVAGVPMLSEALPTDIATEKYPNLVMAQGKFNRASDRLFLGEEKDIKRNLAQLKTAAVEWRDAWAAARDHEAIGTKLRDACEKGFALADGKVKQVTNEMANPDFVKALESR